MLSGLLFPDALPTWALFAELLLAGIVVILAGTRFAKAADQIGNRLNLSGGWTGLILLATVTSLPELVTGGTATAIGNVDLAFGAILGSCSFNITLIVLLNAMIGGGSVLREVSRTHRLTSSFGLLLIAMALFGIVLMDKFADMPRAARITEACWAGLIFLTYLVCMRLIYKYEKSQNAGKDQGSERRAVGRSLTMQVILMASVLVVASWWLAKLGDVLSTHKIEWLGRPLGATFVGACFLALATSLPEIVTSIAAVRLGNLDLALGNIFGSNMFNIFVIPWLKIVSISRGDVIMLTATASDSTQNLIAGLTAILLTTIAIGGLTYQSQRKMLKRFGFDSILIAIIYAGGLFLLLAGTN